MSDIVDDLSYAAKQAWGLVLLRGILALVLGIVALVWPGPTALVVIVLFGIWALADGIIALISIFTGGGRKWGWLLLEGVLGIVAGIIAFRSPLSVALALVLVAAFWAIMVGVLEISGAFQLRNVSGSGWGWVLLSGIVSVIFGILLFAWPGVGFATLIVLIGIWAVVLGITWIAAAIVLRKDAKAVGEAAGF